MRAEKKFNTTLGELIVAVSEEVAPMQADHATTNALVAYIVQDLFLKRRARLRKKSSLKEIVEMSIAA